jgi:hypothetical protein
VERILSMLAQYLISNQSLELNESFNVYVKILSIDHMALKAKEKRGQQKKRTKTFYEKLKKKHFGAKDNVERKYNFYWALDVPTNFAGESLLNFFDNKCLLICTALGLLQNQYLESSHKGNRTFLHIQEGIKSSNQTKQKKAANLLANEVHNIILKTNLVESGPYELESTTELLSQHFKCQFIIFNGINNMNKLLYMFPKDYDDSLMPIYLYNPAGNNNHFVYIKKLS